MWVAEGHLVFGSTKGIGISTGDKPIQEWLESLGFKNYTRVSYIKNSTILFKIFTEFLGFKIKDKAQNKKVPSPILNASKSEQINFLRGFFDGDGNASIKGVKCSSTSYRLMADIQIMLLNLGIKSRIYNEVWPPTKLVKAESRGYSLTMDKINSYKFFENVGFRLERKQTFQDSVSDLNNCSLYLDPYQYVDIVKNLISKSNYSISQWNKENTNIEGYLYRGNGGISYKAINELLEKCDDSLEEYHTLKRGIESLNYEYNNEIVSIDLHEEMETFDLKVPNSESFICNNLVNHNTGGKCIAISTPYGTGNWFHKTFIRAEEGLKLDENSNKQFIPVKLPWWVHPERDEQWRREQDILLGDPKIAAQECDADFSTSGDTVFPNEWVEWIEQNQILDPIERRGVDQNYWIWELPDYSRDYEIVVDVARGDGKDFSAIQVIDIEANIQVAEFKGQLSPRELGLLAISIATEYNMGLLIVENNNMGWSCLDIIIENGYKNLYYSIKGDSINAESYFRNYDNPENLVPGFNTSIRLRPLIINKFREYVGDRGVTIRSKRLVEEMKVFIWRNGRADAQYGYNDDLIMCMSIGTWLRDTSLRFQQHNLDLTRSVLSSIKKENPLGGYKSNSFLPNPYTMNIQSKNPHHMKSYGNNHEDISWLL